MRRIFTSGRAARAALFAAIAGLFIGSLIYSAETPGVASPATAPARLATTSAPVDAVLAGIREEGLNRSQAPRTIDYLCNVIGPRLTGSPSLLRAAAWTRDSLSSWGLANAHLETWGPFGRGWSLRQFSMQVTEPTSFILNGFPKAWSTGFDQPLEAEVVYIDATTEAALAPYKGKLAGKIVLLGRIREPELPITAPATRLSDEQLSKLAASRPSELLTTPTTEPTTSPTTSPSAEVPAAGPATGPSSPAGQLASARMASRMFAFVAAESPALVLSPTSKGDAGIYFVAGVALPTDSPGGTGQMPTSGRRPRAGPTTVPADDLAADANALSATRASTMPSTRPTAWSPNAPKTPPQVVLGIEDFNRLVRLAKSEIPVKVRVDLKVQFYDDDPMVPNVVAEIPGTDLADEIVMVGAHLDSWHAGTGATDNAAGSVAAMEAVRIIKALNLRPRRTIRIGLWTGEEQGLLGSSDYVKKHFGRLDERSIQPSTSPTTNRATRRGGGPSSRPSTLIKGPEYEKLSAYFNLDNGTGRIRGIYCQGNEAAVPIFRQWIEPFADLDASTITLSNTGGTDHLSFDRIGLPGFQFIQDPMDYRSRTHHSNQDNFDRIQMQDLKQASTIMAWFVWKAANEPERFPRKPMPATRGR